MAVCIEMEGYTMIHFNRRNSILTETKREPPHTALRGITGSFASSEELFD